MDERARELLTRAGITVGVQGAGGVGEEGKLRVQCLRAAQHVRQRGCRSVGLLPASADVSVVGIGVNLAIAMAELTGSTVAYVDANMRWPALASLLDANQHAQQSDQPFQTHWLRGDVALLVPQARVLTGAGVHALTEMLGSSKPLFAHSFVDLTGWRRVGEHLAAYDILDGIAVVARAGVTSEDQLLRLGHELPRDRDLGVLLLNADEVA